MSKKCDFLSVISQKLHHKLFALPRSLYVIANSNLQPPTALISTGQVPIYTPGLSERQFTTLWPRVLSSYMVWGWFGTRLL